MRPRVDTYKAGAVLPVRVVDGVPACPVHGDPMVRTGDAWRCADAARLDDALRPLMLAACDRALRRP